MRTLETVSIRDWLTLVRGPELALFIRLGVESTDGLHETYSAPLAMAAPGSPPREHRGAVIAHLESPSGKAILYDALESDAYCRTLLELIEATTRIASRYGELRGLRTLAFPPVQETADLGTIRRGSVEQSNTTLIFDARLLMKVFRKLEAGINPDYEIGTFLTEKTTLNCIPKTLGCIEYRESNSAPTTLAILREYMHNQGQGWEWALRELGPFYDRVGGGNRPDETIASSRPHLFELSDAETPAEVIKLVGSTLNSAGVLGKRTGEMHRALACDPDDPAFAPEPLTRDDLKQQLGRLNVLATEVFNALEAKRSGFDDSLDEVVSLVLQKGPDLLESLDSDAIDAPNLVKIRCHGDYHLGQVLWRERENDFFLLDFEGEPGRTIAERRKKHSPIKDVAGMLRSFDYAASSQLLNSIQAGVGTRESLEPWADLWRTWTSAAFLRGYREATVDSLFFPSQAIQSQRLLDLFVLEKLMFELRYELNYRPEWARIPLLALGDSLRSGSRSE